MQNQQKEETIPTYLQSIKNVTKKQPEKNARDIRTRMVKSGYLLVRRHNHYTTYGEIVGVGEIVGNANFREKKLFFFKICNSNTMGCPPVRGDNPRA